MRNQAINATFDCFKKSSNTSHEKEDTKSICIRGGTETNLDQIEEVYQNRQNETHSDLFQDLESFGDNISTGQRTDSRLNQSNINVSEENKEKNIKQNFIEKENKTEQKTSFLLEYYSSYIESIKKDKEKKKEISKIKKVIDAGNIKPYIPIKYRIEPQNNNTKDQSENRTQNQNISNLEFFGIPNNIGFNVPNYQLNQNQTCLRNNIQFSTSTNQFNPYVINSDFSLSSLNINIAKLMKTIRINDETAISIYKEYPGDTYRLVEYRLENNNHNENNIINNYYFHDIKDALNYVNEYFKREEKTKLNSEGIKK